ncbi:MAG: hypothetical protein ACKOB3_05560 [Holophagaceae bacterium]
MDRQYTRHIREAAALAEYSNYLQTKHKWNQDTYDDIDWKALKMAARNYFSTEVHLLKIIHNYLPTRAHVAKFQPWIPATCQYCDQKETLHHLQTCQCHPASKAYRETTQQNVKKYFDKFAAPNRFREAFELDLRQCLLIEDDESPQTLRAHRAQKTIGTHLITRGFISAEWRRLLHTAMREERWANAEASTSQRDPAYFLDSLDSDENLETAQEETIPTISDATSRIMVNPYNREVIAAKKRHEHEVEQAAAKAKKHQQLDTNVFLSGLIKLLWSDIGDLWINHLSIIHNRKEQTTIDSEETRRNLQTHVRLVQRLKSKTDPIQRNSYFPEDANEFIEKSTTKQLEQYIKAYKPIILKSVKLARITGMAVGAFIRRVLTWKPQHDTNDDNDSATNTSDSTQATHDRSPIAQETEHSALEEAPHRKRNRLRNSGTDTS